MALTCTRCEGSGFLNLEQVPDFVVALGEQAILLWIDNNADHDVQVCDCCGDGTNWHGIAGQHYSSDDRRGPAGPYAYNGGLCECH